MNGGKISKSGTEFGIEQENKIIMVHKEIVGNELYVYMNGKLTYKKWLNGGSQSITFDVMAYRKSDVLVSLKQNCYVDFNTYWKKRLQT